MLTILLRDYFNLQGHGIVFAKVGKARIEYANPYFLEKMGYSIKELREIPSLELVHPEDLPETIVKVGEMTLGKWAKKFVNRNKKHDGSYIRVEWHSVQIGNWYVSRVVFPEK